MASLSLQDPCISPAEPREVLGPQRPFLTTVRMYLDAGLPVSGGTDASVVPYSPFWVIYHFVTRDTIRRPHGGDQKISREDALRW